MSPRKPGTSGARGGLAANDRFSPPPAPALDLHVWQLPIDDHPFLAELYGVLCTEPPVTVPVPPGFRAALEREPDAASPDVPLPMGPLAGGAPLQSRLQLHGRFSGVRATWYYPAGGGAGWHTNSNHPGWRVYVVRATSADSAMLLPGGRRVPDRPGGFANMFCVPPGGAWHAVDAVTERWSVGLEVPEALAVLLLALGQR